MKYISGLHALNLPCSLDTTGDWHSGSMNWGKITVLESCDSPWGEYGIEKERHIPYADGIWAIANHVRACLDMIYVGDFPNARGMKNDYIGNEKYDGEIFDKIICLKDNCLWPLVDKFMEKEYLMKWVRYRRQYL